MELSRTRIKICGICRPEDARDAAACGADALGLIFHPPAPRFVNLDAARQILDAVPPFVTPVGLFVDVSVDHVFDTTRVLGLRHVQLNGHESPEFIAELAPLVVIKAVRVERETFGETLAGWREGARALRLTHLKGLVLETAGTGRAGGTGVANDWETVRHHRARGDFVGLPPVIAAGGLTPDTVEVVVRDVRPWAVDVSSGVEVERGRKSPERMRAFVEAVRRADAG